jgi:hypothetical protein
LAEFGKEVVNLPIPIDAIATVFIFLIGLPAIFLQTLPSEIRRVVLKRRRQLVTYTFIPIAFSGLVVVAGIRVSILCLKAAVSSSNNNEFLVFIWGSNGELLWLTVLLILLLIAVVAAIVLTARWRRETVINQLSGDAAQGISHRGRPVESELKDLIQLGKQSHPGQDKELVLQALANLAETVQMRPAYDGAQLEELIIGLEEIIVLGTQIGSPENFHTAADLLSDIIISACNKTHSHDLKLAIQTVSMLGRASLRHEPSHIQQKFVEALGLANEVQKDAATWMSQALFEIGSEAAERNQILIAMASLSKHEAIAAQYRPISDELATDFIGLLAHFWVHGETAKNYIIPILADASTFFSQPLPQAIQLAQAHCKQTAKFKTADHLFEMLKEIQEGLPKAQW